MRENKITQYLFWLAAIALLVPVWYFNFYPATDGPSHIANAINIKRLLLGECDLAKEFFEFTAFPVPNWGGHIILAALSFFFSAITAEKILISLYLLTFAGGVKSLTDVYGRDKLFLAFPALIFAHNWLLFSGTYNFLLSFTLGFYAISWYLKKFCHTRAHIKYMARVSRLDSRVKPENDRFPIIKLTLIFLGLYFMHLFGLGLFWLAILCIEVGDWLRRENNFRMFVIRGLKIFAAALPCFALFAWHSTSDKMAIEGFISFGDRLVTAIIPSVIAVKVNAYDVTQNGYIVLSKMLAVIVWALVICKMIYTVLEKREALKRFEINYFSYLCFLLFLAILFTPISFAGGWMIQMRAQLVMFILLPLCFVSLNLNALARRAVIAISLIVLGVHMTLLWNDLSKYQPSLTEFATAEKYIPENSVFLAIDLNPYTVNYTSGEQNTRAMVPDISGYIIAEKCSVDAYNYHAAEKNTFPLSFRESMNPYNTLGQFRTVNAFGITPPDVDLAGFEAKTGKKLEYLVIRGREDFLKYNPKDEVYNSEELYARLMKQVNVRYELLHESAGGLVRVYRATSPRT